MRLVSILVCGLILAPAAEVRSFVVESGKVRWVALSLPGVPAGLQQQLFHENKETKLLSAKVRFPKGFREPRHYHTTCGHSMYILKGRLKSPERVLTAGMFIYAAPNERHGPFEAEEDTEFLFYTDGPFDFFVEDGK